VTGDKLRFRLNARKSADYIIKVTIKTKKLNLKPGGIGQFQALVFISVALNE
jgi:hypothetical protein